MSAPPSAPGVSLLTASRVSLRHRCPRAEHYRYELGRVSTHENTNALAFGTAVHAGLESWWRSHQRGDVEGALHAAIDAAGIGAWSDDHSTHDDARLYAMLVAYDVRWSRWAAGVEVIGVEAAFEAPLTHPDTGVVARTWRLAGKLDALVMLADGRVAIIEHKTTSQDAGAGSDYRRRLTLDGQVSMYFTGARALGHAADLCVYDVLAKPAQKPLLATPPEARKYTQGRPATKTREAEEPRLYAGQRENDETPVEYRDRLIAAIGADPDRYLMHAEIVRSPDEIAAHARDLWETVHSIEHGRARVKAGALPPRHATACFAHHTPCQYLDVCEGTARIDDDTRYRHLPLVHQELGR